MFVCNFVGISREQYRTMMKKDLVWHCALCKPAVHQEVSVFAPQLHSTGYSLESPLEQDRGHITPVQQEVLVFAPQLHSTRYSLESLQEQDRGHFTLELDMDVTNISNADHMHFTPELPASVEMADAEELNADISVAVRDQDRAHFTIELPDSIEMDDVEEVTEYAANISDAAGERDTSYLQESSLADPAPVNAHAADDVLVRYTINPSSSIRGGDQLFSNIGYSYTVKRRKGTTTTWRCSLRSKLVNCPATVHQSGDDFTPGAKAHVHPMQPGTVVVANVAKRLQEETRDRPLDPAGAIVEGILQELITDEPCPTLLKFCTLTRTAYRLRQKSRPRDPTYLTFDIDELQLDPNFFRRDIKVGDKRHFLTAGSQLELLQSAKTWYLDSTFKVVCKPFTQLFSIHAFIRKDECAKQVPLVFCLMSGKKKRNYKHVLRAILELLPTH